MTWFAESFPESLLRIRPWAGRPEAESSQAQWPQGEEKEVTWENTIVKKRWGWEAKVGCSSRWEQHLQRQKRVTNMGHQEVQVAGYI